MTFEEILRIEDVNEGKIYLHREGTFLKAYDHSAFLVWKYVSPFKLRRRFVKKVNRHVNSCGFPESVAGKWLHGYKVEEIQKDLLVCHIEKPFDEAEYAAFEDEAKIQTSEAELFTPRRNIIERQAVYQTAIDLANFCLQIGRNIPRTDLVPYGNDLKTHSYELAYKVGKLYDQPDREAAVREMSEHINKLNFALKMLKDAKDISVESFAQAGQMAEGVRSQLEALKHPKQKTEKPKDAEAPAQD